MGDFNEKTLHKFLCKNIKAIRRDHEWSQEYIAKRMGISIPAFSKIETGVTDINLSRLEQIANIYKISPAQLLTISSESIASPLAILQKKLEKHEAEIDALRCKITEMSEAVRAKRMALQLAEKV